MASMLQDVPGLADEVDIEVSALSALTIDPMDERRLAFQLGDSQAFLHGGFPHALPSMRMDRRG